MIASCTTNPGGPFRQRNEAARARHIFGVARLALGEQPVEHRHTRHPHEQGGHHCCTEKRPHGGTLSGSDDRQAPPHEAVTEVIRVTSERPETLVHDLIGIPRVALEACELSVTHGFEIQSHAPNNEAQQRDEAQARVGVALAKADWQRHDEHQRTLQTEHAVQTDDGKPFTVPATHGAVAEIFALAEIASSEVSRKAQAPDRDHHQQQPIAAARGTSNELGGPRHQYETETPHDVDDRRIALDERDRPCGEHQTRNGHSCGSKHRRHVGHETSVGVAACLTGDIAHRVVVGAFRCEP